MRGWSVGLETRGFGAYPHFRIGSLPETPLASKSTRLAVILLLSQVCSAYDKDEN